MHFKQWYLVLKCGKCIPMRIFIATAIVLSLSACLQISEQQSLQQVAWDEMKYTASVSSEPRSFMRMGK